jgi:AhpC/TSA family
MIHGPNDRRRIVQEADEMGRFRVVEAVASLLVAAIEKAAGALLERARDEFGSIKLKDGQTLGDLAKSELYDSRVLAIGKPAPEVAGEDIDGKPMKLSDFRGKVVVLSFQRRRDELSRQDAAFLARLAGRLNGRSLAVVGLAPETPMGERLGVRRVPTTVVVDAEGLLRFQCGWSPLVGDFVERLVEQAEVKPPVAKPSS